jgi:hypothetical protein
MRLVGVLAAVCLAACAGEKLAQAPPAGVDFTGHWKLNEADSDDPQRLVQTQFNAPGAGQNTSSGGQGGGTGGRGGRQGGGRGGGAGAMNLGGPGGPLMPPAGVLGEGLRWPGKQLDIKQVAGVVAFTSDGNSRVCQPTGGGKTHRARPESGDGHRPEPGGRDSSSGRGAPSRGRDAPPPRCGWAEKTLIVQGGDPDDDHPPFEEHYSLSDDGQRLVEVVNFKGGRSSGFTMSRVWDRLVQ